MLCCSLDWREKSTMSKENKYRTEGRDYEPASVLMERIQAARQEQKPKKKPARKRAKKR